jgi:hypothetical protein
MERLSDGVIRLVLLFMNEDEGYSTNQTGAPLFVGVSGPQITPDVSTHACLPAKLLIHINALFAKGSQGSKRDTAPRLAISFADHPGFAVLSVPDHSETGQCAMTFHDAFLAGITSSSFVELT